MRLDGFNAFQGGQFCGFVLRGANMNSTADQLFTKVGQFTAYRLNSVFVTNASISLTTAAGGIYPTTAKGGTALVASSQVYSSLTAATAILTATIAGAGSTTRHTGMDWYLSLTTGQGAAATADFYISILAFEP
jgi:hypothetical protein